jgi:hypothetical protein
MICQHKSLVEDGTDFPKKGKEKPPYNDYHYRQQQAKGIQQQRLSHGIRLIVGSTFKTPSTARTDFSSFEDIFTS